MPHFWLWVIRQWVVRSRSSEAFSGKATVGFLMGACLDLANGGRDPISPSMGSITI